MLGGGVVVDNHMDVEILRDILVNVFEKTEIFLMAMPWFTCSDDLSFGDVQGSKEGCCSMADIVVGDAFDVSEPDGQHWLSAIECLDLAFFIHAQDNRLVG